MKKDKEKIAELQNYVFNLISPSTKLNADLSNIVLDIYSAGYDQGYNDCMVREKRYSKCPFSDNENYSGLQEGF